MPNLTYIWIKDSNLNKYSPIMQAYGVCFNDDDEILVIRKPGGKTWKIPGGSPENGESALETLERELYEEATVRVTNCIPLGVMEINYPDNPNKAEGEHFFQARFVCKVQDLEEQTVDPANGILHDRMFVPAEEICDYVTWGDYGDQMFRDAIDVWNLQKS